ncbi:MAG: CCA tRNA nucleotidyltransferase [Nitrospirae bacterium]|nr:CCA tRNA nucleotidyltransferase [Nitrospirota bacterium]
MHLSKKILSDPVTRWFFSRRKNRAYLVGGYLRDILLARHSKDRDFVVTGNAEEISKLAARRFNGKFISLKKGLTCRVALKERGFIDINHLEGSIEDDIKLRDYTLNALAWSPETGIIDPCGGLNDIRKRRIKVVSAENLKKDPLRILRAYRLSAELSFTIDKDTREYLKQYSGMLSKPAPERITSELIKLLNLTDAGKYLKECARDNVLGKLLRVDEAVINKNIRFINKFDRILNSMEKEKRVLDEEISQELKRAGLIRLVLLLIDAGTLHPKNLKLSRINISALMKIIESIGDMRTLKKAWLFSFLKETEPYALESMIILAVILNKDIDTYLNDARYFMKIMKAPIVTGDEIQKILNIPPCRKVGEALSAIEEARFYRKIRTRREARAYIQSHC